MTLITNFENYPIQVALFYLSTSCFMPSPSLPAGVWAPAKFKSTSMGVQQSHAIEARKQPGGKNKRV